MLVHAGSAIAVTDSRGGSHSSVAVLDLSPGDGPSRTTRNEVVEDIRWNVLARYPNARPARTHLSAGPGDSSKAECSLLTVCERSCDLSPTSRRRPWTKTGRNVVFKESVENEWRSLHHAPPIIDVSA
jgi:hypothetical protein